MNVFVACESSGKVRNAFLKAGHNAWSCDLLPADDGKTYGSQFHLQKALPMQWPHNGAIILKIMETKEND